MIIQFNYVVPILSQHNQHVDEYEIPLTVFFRVPSVKRDVVATTYGLRWFCLLGEEGKGYLSFLKNTLDLLLCFGMSTCRRLHY